MNTAMQVLLSAAQRWYHQCSSTHQQLSVINHCGGSHAADAIAARNLMQRQRMHNTGIMFIFIRYIDITERRSSAARILSIQFV
jgi:hypothetical protein